MLNNSQFISVFAALMKWIWKCSTCSADAAKASFIFKPNGNDWTSANETQRFSLSFPPVLSLWVWFYCLLYCLTNCCNYSKSVLDVVFSLPLTFCNVFFECTKDYSVCQTMSASRVVQWEEWADPRHRDERRMWMDIMIIFYINAIHKYFIIMSSSYFKMIWHKAIRRRIKEVKKAAQDYYG